MRKLILKIFFNTLAFYCATLFFPVIRFDQPTTLLWAGIILGLINLVIRPLLFLLTLPINFLTLGLFTIIINTWMIILTDSLLTGLYIPGFWLATATSLLVSTFNLVLQGLFEKV